MGSRQQAAGGRQQAAGGRLQEAGCRQQAEASDEPGCACAASEPLTFASNAPIRGMVIHYVIQYQGQAMEAHHDAHPAREVQGTRGIDPHPIRAAACAEVGSCREMGGGDVGGDGLVIESDGPTL